MSQLQDWHPGPPPGVLRRLRMIGRDADALSASYAQGRRDTLREVAPFVRNVRALKVGDEVTLELLRQADALLRRLEEVPDDPA